MYYNPSNDTKYSSHSEVRSAFPGVSLPAILTDEIILSLGVYPLMRNEPDYDQITHAVRELQPAFSPEGYYEERWEVYGVDPDQAAAALVAAKEAKNNEINEARLTANFTSFDHAGKTFACDQLSRSDIDGTNGYVTLNGVLPQGWPGGWKAVDNTYIPITSVDDWKAFYASMFAQGNASFAKAQALKAALEVATTAAEIAAIRWDSE